MYLCIRTQATIKRAFLRDYHYSYSQATQTGFLILKEYHSLEHAETKKYMFLFRYKQNEWSVFYSFHFGAHLALNFDMYHDNDRYRLTFFGP